MKKIILLLILFITLSLSGCNSRNVKLSKYDLTDLETCLVNLSDENDNTDCTVSQRDELLKAYGEYFLDDLDDATTLDTSRVYLYLSTPSVIGGDFMLYLTYTMNSDLDLEKQFNKAQKVFETISFDVFELTDLYVRINTSFIIDEDLTLTFVSSVNSTDESDYHNKYLITHTEEIYASGMFTDYLDFYLSGLNDDAYKYSTFSMETEDYSLQVKMAVAELSYQMSLIPIDQTHLVDSVTIEQMIQELMLDYQLVTEV